MSQVDTAAFSQPNTYEEDGSVGLNVIDHRPRGNGTRYHLGFYLGQILLCHFTIHLPDKSCQLKKGSLFPLWEGGKGEALKTQQAKDTKQKHEEDWWGKGKKIECLLITYKFPNATNVYFSIHVVVASQTSRPFVIRAFTCMQTSVYFFLIQGGLKTFQ